MNFPTCRGSGDGTRTSGKSGPRDGKWHIQLRMGWADERIAYEPGAIKWIWGYHAGDVVAVRDPGT